MTPEGYHQIMAAFAAGDVAAEIRPIPEEYEDVRFFDVKTSSCQSFADVMNSLGKAGLLLDECGDDHQDQRPALTLVSSELRTPNFNYVDAEFSRAFSPENRYSTFEDYKAHR